MIQDHHNELMGASQGASFCATHWSVVLAAGQQRTGEGALALEELCRIYWRPIYCYIRRRGYSPPDAEDLTQSLFARLLARNDLAGVNPAKGKFRSFLLASVEHLMADGWDRATRIKRGGSQPMLSLDVERGERGYELAAAENRSADTLYDRQWALVVIETVMTKLELEYSASGRGALFAALKGLLIGNPEGGDSAPVAQQLAMSENAVRVAIHRLRRRFAESFRNEVAATLADPADAEAEMRHLLASVST